jgi:hypothetical protein
MQLPIVFTYRQPILGNGFVAGVRMRGRAIIENEGQEVWVTGVAPAGFAGGGLDRTSAIADFRKGWTVILFDIACESTSYEDFQAKSRTFLESSVDDMTEHWEAARAAIRGSGYAKESMPTASKEEQVVEIEIVDLTQYAPRDNEFDDPVKAAA